MNKNLGERIIQIRTEKNMTQGELASRVGVTRQAISKWERGDGLPDLYNVSKLAKALNVSVDDLLDNNHTYQSSTTNDININNIGGSFKKLLYKAKNTTNSEYAKKVKKYLLIGGGIGLLVGIFMIGFGFFGFAAGALNAVNGTTIDFDPTTFNPDDITMPKPFNPIPYMVIFLLGGVVSGISVYVLFAGLSIVIAGVTTSYLDTRDKCPKCGDAVDIDERSCSNCGYNLEENNEHRCSCGKENQPSDKFCRECGSKL